MCEVLSCVAPSLKLIVLVVYRPPSASHKSFENVLSFMRSKIDCVPTGFKVIISGDFNFPSINWDEGIVRPGSSGDTAKSADKLLKFVNDSLMNQYIRNATRGSNILDLFFCTDPFLVNSVSITSTALSDHNMIEVIMPLTSSSNGSEPNQNIYDGFQSLDFSQADFDQLNDQFSRIDWDSEFQLSTVQDNPIIFTSIMLSTCEALVPKRSIRTGKPRKLRSLRRKRRRVNKRLEHLKTICGNPDHIASLERKIAILTFDINQEIQNDLDRREAKVISKLKDNPKVFYGYAKKHSTIRNEITMLKTDSGYITDKKSVAEIFQRQFSSVFSDPAAPGIEDPHFIVPNTVPIMPDCWSAISNSQVQAAIEDIRPSSSPGPDGVPAILLKKCASTLAYPIKLLLERSIEEKTVPDYYKLSHVCPLHKKGDRSKPENYRPVSKTSHIIKTHERVLRKKLVHHFETNFLISSTQHGFRTGRNTLTQLLQHFDAIYEGLVDNADTDSIYLDYEKAFDKVDHRLLLLKLKKYKVHNLLINWIKSFLEDRVQIVAINGNQSKPVKIISGVPQGTVLGPVLFIIFLNDLVNAINRSSVSLFADDTRISCQINSSDDCRSLQDDLNSVMDWSTKNNMQLHSQKFELIIHRARPIEPFHNLPFGKELCSYDLPGGVSLHESSQLRDLGVTVSADGTWGHHINSMVEKARNITAWVLSVFKSRDKDMMVTLYRSLIRSHLEYCCPLWNPNKVGDIQKIEDVQRTFTNKIAQLQGHNYYERLAALDMMSLQRRRERYIIIHMWKILNDLAPNDINVTFRHQSRLGWQAERRPLRRHARQVNQTLHDGSFAMAGPTLWNCIPASIHKIRKLDPFKSALTKFLKTIPDYPPVSGYPSSGSNSITNRRTGGSLLGL